MQPPWIYCFPQFVQYVPHYTKTHTPKPGPFSLSQHTHSIVLKKPKLERKSSIWISFHLCNTQFIRYSFFITFLSSRNRIINHMACRYEPNIRFLASSGCWQTILENFDACIRYASMIGKCVENEIRVTRNYHKNAWHIIDAAIAQFFVCTCNPFCLFDTWHESIDVISSHLKCNEHCADAYEIVFVGKL